MPLLIEDGTGVAGANSYITVDELRAYALDRGVSFPAAPTSGVDPAIAWATPLLIRACDYIESKRDLFAGMLAAPATQELCFPRINIYLTGFQCYGAQMLPLIPLQIKKAQAQLVLEQMSGVALFVSQAAQGVGVIPNGPSGAIANADGRVVIMEKLDVIETQWSDTQGTNTVPYLWAVDAILKPLMVDSGMFFTGVRI